MHIAVIFGTRPEAIKLIPVIKELQNKDNVKLTIISTGQHKEMLKPILDWFDVKPDFDLDVMKPDQTLSSISSLLLDHLDRLFEKLSPDILLVQGDTVTAFISSLAAFYRKIKVGHVEAGLRTYNNLSPWPEEVNRNLIARIADFHFAPTENNKNNLLKENISQENIFVTGNTVIDALQFSAMKAKENNVYSHDLERFYNGDQRNSKIVLITGHRRENFGEGFISISKAIKKLAEMFPEVYFIYPVHLNPNVQSVVKEYLENLQNVCLIAPLGYPEFISLMQRSYLILTDSGGVQEEGPGLGKPILVMRDNTERPEALEYGTVKLVGTKETTIIKEVSALLNNEAEYLKMSKAVNPYGDGKSSSRIVSQLIDNS